MIGFVVGRITANHVSEETYSTEDQFFENETFESEGFITEVSIPHSFETEKFKMEVDNQ